MLTVFFIKIGKTKEKWLVIYKVICNLKFFRTCFLDKYMTVPVEHFPVYLRLGSEDRVSPSLQEYSCQCSGCFPELPFGSHASILDFTHSNGI